jgi:hypothetical protein
MVVICLPATCPTWVWREGTLPSMCTMQAAHGAAAEFRAGELELLAITHSSVAGGASGAPSCR